MTATTFNDPPGMKKDNEVITAEILYHRMFALNIPMECQKWHLNRLLTQIKVCAIKNSPPKKMDRKTQLSERARLNALRRQKYNTRG
jgi:hypothetical protein